MFSRKVMFYKVVPLEILDRNDTSLMYSGVEKIDFKTGEKRAFLEKACFSPVLKKLFRGVYKNIPDRGNSSVFLSLISIFKNCVKIM